MKILELAVEIAQQAGNMMLASQKNLDQLKSFEKASNDFVTEADIAVEKFVIETIKKHYPEHAILGEESGASEDSASDYQWIIDPIDGTANFSKGVPHFAISIGIRYQNELLHGVIFDPSRQELFTATKGQGAYVNGRRLAVSQQKLQGGLITTGFPCRRHELIPHFMQVFQAVFPLSRDMRRNGSAALDLAYVAAGRFDAYFEHSIALWDIAAGALMVQEAGGIVINFNGEAKLSSNIIAGNSKIAQQLLQIIKS